MLAKLLVPGWAVVALFSLVSSAEAQRHLPQAIFPHRVNPSLFEAAPYRSVGFLVMDFGADTYRGSASVVRHPSLLYTCGHNLLDGDGTTLATEVNFSRVWHSRQWPKKAGLVPLRGFDPLASYGAALLDFGKNSAEGFASDFGVAWTNQQVVLGPPLASYPNATDVVTDETLPKMVLGYPATIDFNGRPGRHFLHQTGPFTRAFQQTLGQLYEMERFSTGSGNSGGPVFVQEEESWRVAGILVSGSEGRMAGGGIFVLHEEAHNLGTAAIMKSEEDEAEVTLPEDEEFFGYNDRQVTLRGGRAFVPRTFRFRRIPTYLTSARLDLSVTTPGSGNLHIFLRSPSGRVRPITQPDPNLSTDESNFLFEQDISGVFFGSNPNGVWRLFLRDVAVGSTSEFQEASLTITAR